MSSVTNCCGCYNGRCLARRMWGPMAGGEGELMARKCSIRGDDDAFAGRDRGASEETSKPGADRRRDALSEASRILGANIVSEREERRCSCSMAERRVRRPPVASLPCDCRPRAFTIPACLPAPVFGAEIEVGYADEIRPASFSQVAFAESACGVRKPHVQACFWESGAQKPIPYLDFCSRIGLRSTFAPIARNSARSLRPTAA